MRYSRMTASPMLGLAAVCCTLLALMLPAAARPPVQGSSDQPDWKRYYPGDASVELPSTPAVFRGGDGAGEASWGTPDSYYDGLRRGNLLIRIAAVTLEGNHRIDPGKALTGAAERLKAALSQAEVRYAVSARGASAAMLTGTIEGQAPDAVLG